MKDKTKWWYFGKSVFRLLLVIILIIIVLQLSEVIGLLTRFIEAFGG